MKTFLILLVLCLAATAAAAESIPQARPLTEADRADVARIEAYLNNLKNVSADFLQLDDNGGVLRGTMAIQRPGKMRVTYDPPSRDFIIADGSHVHIWNDDLKEQTNVDEKSSLAEFILRDPVSLGGDVTIIDFRRFPAKLELSLAEADDPGAGTLILVFEDRPLKLRQWKVVDPQGHTTGVNLENVRYDVAFPARIFEFVPPNFGHSRSSEAP